MDMNTSRLGRFLVLLITCAVLALPVAAQPKTKDAKAAVTKKAADLMAGKVRGRVDIKI